MKTSTLLKNFSSWITALIFLLAIFAPVQADEQQPEPTLPLYPKLTWTTEIQSQSVKTTNGEMLISGNVHTAQEAINLDAADNQELVSYYGEKSLSSFGWDLISQARLTNSNIDTYFHTSGYYLLVSFSACEDNEVLACLSIWMSDQTQYIPEETSRVITDETAGTLSKVAPTNGATNIDPASATLSWNSYTGSGLNRYRYCIDTSNDNECTSGDWTNTWNAKSVILTNLQGSQTYYWQVQAVLNDNSKVDANDGSWWSFSTKATTPPVAFSKLLPANNAVNQSTTPVLTWQASTGATSYAYCIDTTNNNICDNNWVSTSTNTSATLLSGLTPNTAYYWQARATNNIGTTNADSGWHLFTTGTSLPNDFLESATLITVPYKSSLNTISATIDSGTENSCSPGAGFASVWYKYTPAANGKLYLDTLSSNYDTFIAVWRQTSPTNTLVTCNDDQYGTKQSAINLSVTASTTYYIQIGHRNANTIPTQTPGGNLSLQVRSFSDVLGNNGFWTYIESLKQSGITGGCASSPDLLFCPVNSVTRAEMAVFLLRGIHGSSYTPPAAGSSTGFDDVASTHWAAAWIKQLAAEGITTGCGANLFCPEAAVTRDQMAIFLLRAKHGSSYSPPSAAGNSGFGDVPSDHWAIDWIKQLAAEGITSGCGGGNYCPGANTTRDQMAVFIVRTFSLPLVP